MPKSIPHPDYAEDGVPRSEAKFRSKTNITILDKAGQDAMRKVCKFGREVLDIVAAAVKPGATTDQLDEICHNECIKREASFSPSFPHPIHTKSPTSPTPPH